MAVFFGGKKIQVYYTVDNPTKSWKGGKGYISKDIAVKGLPGPAEDTLILVSVILESCLCTCRI